MANLTMIEELNEMAGAFTTELAALEAVVNFTSDKVNAGYLGSSETRRGFRALAGKSVDEVRQIMRAFEATVPADARAEMVNGDDFGPAALRRFAKQYPTVDVYAVNFVCGFVAGSF